MHASFRRHCRRSIVRPTRLPAGIPVAGQRYRRHPGLSRLAGAACLRPRGRFIQAHCYVVRSPRHTVLIDTCVGNDKQRPSTRAWNGLDTDFPDRLRDIGVTPADVDYVLCTHLQQSTMSAGTPPLAGRWVPTSRMRASATRWSSIIGRTQWRLCSGAGRKRHSTRTAYCRWSPPGRPRSWPTATDRDWLTVESWPGHSPGHVCGLEAVDREFRRRSAAHPKCPPGSGSSRFC